MMRAYDDDVQMGDLREAVAMLEPPPLAGDTLGRIAAGRDNGERTVLPTSDPSRATIVRRPYLIAALSAVAAAAVIVGLAIDSRRGSATADHLPDTFAAITAADSICATFSPTTDPSLLRHLMISAFGVSAACGASPMPDAPIAYVASQIVSGTFVYRGLSVTDDVFTSIHEPTSLSVVRTTWKGTPAILASRVGAVSTGTHMDSLFVSANDLTALHFASWYNTQHPKGSIHADFDSATVRIAMTGHFDSVATIAYHMQPGQLPFGFAIPLAVPALPLAIGWHGSIEIAPPIHPRVASLFRKPWERMSLRVLGRERLRVAAGTFDCWKVRIGEPEDRSFVWVDTRTHVVVRSNSIHRFGDTSFEDQVDLERADFAPR